MCITNLYVYSYVAISSVVLCMLCTQGSAENQLVLSGLPRPSLNITITMYNVKQGNVIT